MTIYSYQYRRSNNIDILKRTDEGIKENFSSEQYMSALDTLISYTVEPIINSSNFLDEKLAKLMVHHSETGNTKHSIHDRHTALSLLMLFVCKKPEGKLEVWNRLGLHRNYPLTFATEWLSLVKGYRKLFWISPDNETVKGIHASVYHDPKKHSSLYAAIAQVSYWLPHALKLRELILEKYHRLVVNESVFLYKKLSHSVDLDDLTQLMFTEALKAVDRCDTTKGPITSFLQQYLRFAGSRIDFEFNTAYTVKGNAPRQDFNYKSVEMTDETEDQIFYTNEQEVDVKHIQYLAKLLDPVGVGRYFLGIEEVHGIV